MCGLFGFSRYGEDKIKNLSELTNSLAQHSAVRGTDATGIAFTVNGGINIVKDSKPAYKMDFKHSDDITALTGHTRHSTQGSEKKMYNNHPFAGCCRGNGRDVKFALCHNGVLCNDKELRKSLNLPKTKVETDSYIAIQLLESKEEVSFDSIKYTAEKTEGSFSYSILDDKNNIWLIKGDSPLSILHFPQHKMYVYASTDEILYRAIIDSPLFEDLKVGNFDVVDIVEGDILKLCPDGTIEKGSFEYKYSFCRGWWSFGMYPYGSLNTTTDNYIGDLKTVASYQGFPPETVDELVGCGFTLEEIEEYIYEY